MDANFFYYSIYDNFIQRQPCACMHRLLTFSLKEFCSETIDWDFYQISHECSLDRG